MTEEDQQKFDEIERLVKSPDRNSVVLGMGYIMLNEYFEKVRTAFGDETEGLPNKFKTFAHVCDFVKKKYFKHNHMCDNWPRNADIIYRPAALLVLEKMRFVCEQTSEEEK